MTNFKNFHIGTLLLQRVKENDIEMTRIINFFHLPKENINQMYLAKSLDSEILLKWSKLLQYDFFRLYSQHLILYSPSSADRKDIISKKASTMPQFRKNIYTKEVIDFVLEKIDKREKTIKEIMVDYRIPKTTLYKWIKKYGEDNKKK